MNSGSADSFPSRLAARLRPGVPGLVLVVWLIIAITIFLRADSPSTVAEDYAAQMEAGKIPAWKTAIVIGTYWGAIANISIVAILLATMKWWAHRRPDSAAPQIDRENRRISKAFYVGLLFIVVIAGGLRWKFANGSLWWDELWNVKMATVGYFRTGSKHPDEKRFYPTDFARCTWYYQKPTNHVPTALASKVCHTIWAKTTRAAPGDFNEFVVRLPVFLSALGSVALIGFAAHRWAGAGAGLLAAFLMAVHPWFIRYGIDARSYGPVVFFTLLALHSLKEAIYRDRWHHWIIFGISQFFLMWSHLHTVWFCGALTIAGTTMLWVRYDASQRWPRIGRLIACNGLAAAAFLQLFFPNLVQMVKWDIVDPSAMNGEMLLTTISHCFTGIEPKWTGDVESAGLVSWETMTAGHLWIMALILVSIGSVAAWGLRFLWKTDKVGSALLIAMAIAMIIFSISAAAFDIYFYSRFAIPMLPVAILALAIGAGDLAHRLTRNCCPRLAFVPLAGSALLFLAMCWPQIRVYQNRSYEPFREVAKFLKEREQETNGKMLAFGYGLGGRIIQVYHLPVEYALYPPADLPLQSTLDRAKADGIPCYIFYGYPAFNKLTLPTGFRLLDDPEVFEEVAAFPGIEPEFYFRVLRAR